MAHKFDTMTLTDMREGLDKGDFTSVEITQYFVDSIKKQNDDINAFLEVFKDAQDQAKEADKRIKKGDVNDLTGIPIALKDNILVEGKKVSASSKILENYTATYDSFVVQKLKSQGAVIIGRTNCDEFAMGSSTENSAFGVVKNPHDTSRVPGGSSGGSAAAIAMNGAPVTLGSDTGGSIRQPASFCGCVGLKPTYGSVSRSGLIAMGSSLDVIGPFARSVNDAKIVFDAIKGNDPKDSTSIQEDTYEEVPVKEKMTIGVPTEFFKEGVSQDILDTFNETIKKLKEKGHTIKEIKLPYIKYSLPVYYVLMPAEASTNLARFDGIRFGLHKEGKDLLEDYTKSREEGFGQEVQRRILLGAYVLSSGYYDAYYGKATNVRHIIKKEFSDAFKDCDVIVTPTTPTPPFKIGEKADPVSMYLADIFTVPANIAGIPAISVPIKSITRHDKELPIGFQVMAPHNGEERLFAIGKDVENCNS